MRPFFLGPWLLAVATLLLRALPEPSARLSTFKMGNITTDIDYGLIRPHSLSTLMFKSILLLACANSADLQASTASFSADFLSSSNLRSSASFLAFSFFSSSIHNSSSRHSCSSIAFRSASSSAAAASAAFRLRSASSWSCFF